MQFPGPLPGLRRQPAGCRSLLSAPAGRVEEDDPSPPTRPPFARFDQAVDALFEPYRGRRRVDTCAAAVSNLADYGVVWTLLGAAKGRRRGEARRRATRALALAGFSSLGVNAAVKAVVGRARPVETDDPGGPVPVRPPSSSSFPSGHTLAAFCTAVTLAEGPAEMATYLAFATAVAASRVHLRAHHPSDVVGGALIGAAIGLGGRRWLRRR